MRSIFTHPKVIIFSILLIGLLIRLPFINGSFWLDEAAQALESVRPLGQQFNIAHDFQPPLYHLWVHLFTYATRAEWWLRLSSLIPGIATIYIVFLLGQKIADKKVGILASLLVATSQIHIFYSQELRPYALAAMLGVLSTYYLFQLFTKKKHYYDWSYIISSVAGLYSVYTFPFLLLAHTLVVFLKFKTNFTRYAKLMLLIIMAFLPWLPMFAQQLKHGLDLQTTVSAWGAVVSLPVLQALPLTLIKLGLGRINLDASMLTLILSGLTVGSWTIALLIARRKKYWCPMMLIIGTTLVSAYIVHAAIPIIEPKRFLFLLPLLSVLAASSISYRWGRYMIISILTINFLSTSLYWLDQDYQREPWRQAVQKIEAIADPQANIVFAFNAPFAPWQWYQAKDLNTMTTGVIKLQDEEILSSRFRSLLLSKEIYVFEYLMDVTDPQRLTLKWITDNNFEEIGYLQYPGIGKIYIFQRGQVYASID